jgi:hypothetical protein
MDVGPYPTSTLLALEGHERTSTHSKVIHPGPGPHFDKVDPYTLPSLNYT